MAAPTLFKRLVIAQVLTSLVLILVFGGAFYVERNRTIARLMAQRWAPALRAAAGLDAASMPLPAPDARSVRVSDQRPLDTNRLRRWAPRLAVLRETLREEGLPVREALFTSSLTTSRPTTWLAVTLPDGHVRWLGFDDDVIEQHALFRFVVSMLCAVVVVAAASWLVARRVARPLEDLRRRMASHQGPAAREGATAPAAATMAAVDPTSTQEIDAIEAAWLELVARLEHQESERALLLAGVSHDLRSPLARIRMAAELLPATDAVAARSASIVRNVDVADRLIASFLEYVRAGELPLDATVDVAAVARRLRETRDEPDDVLRVQAPARLDVPRAHELLLERLIGNLVDNAMRHGKPPVVVRVTEERGRAVIAVDDRGPGIAIADRARMTQAFARGDASRGTPGVGLGLAVVQQIVRRMDGVLSFESHAEVQCVRVELPLR